MTTDNSDRIRLQRCIMHAIDDLTYPRGRPHAVVSLRALHIDQCAKMYVNSHLFLGGPGVKFEAWSEEWQQALESNDYL